VETKAFTADQLEMVEAATDTAIGDHSAVDFRWTPSATDATAGMGAPKVTVRSEDEFYFRQPLRIATMIEQLCPPQILRKSSANGS
jgi:hypothetical protein